MMPVWLHDWWPLIALAITSGCVASCFKYVRANAQLTSQQMKTNGGTTWTDKMNASLVVTGKLVAAVDNLTAAVTTLHDKQDDTLVRVGALEQGFTCPLEKFHNVVDKASVDRLPTVF